MNRLRVIGTALSDLNSRKLVRLDIAEDQQITHCPFDGTPISIDETAHDSRVRCLNCGYTFLASPGYTAIRTLPKSETPYAYDDSEQQAAGVNNSSTEKKTKAAKKKTGNVPGSNKSRHLAFLVTGIALLPLSWLPMLGYALLNSLQGKPAPLIPALGKLGMAGSALAIVIILIGLVLLLKKLLSGTPSTSPTEAATPPAATAAEDHSG